MRVRFETVLDGVNRYIDREIYKNLNDLQEILARIVVGRVNNNAETIKNALMNNGLAKTMCIIDSEGMVDIDQILQEVRREIERKGSLQVDIPMIGKLTFRAEDIDSLRSEIVGR